jgi:predicted permease
MSLATDARFACARLRRAPGFAISVVLMLGLGLALSVTMFGVVRGVLRALPYAGGEATVAVYAANPRQGTQTSALTAAEVDALARPDAQSPFRAFGEYSWGGVTVYNEGQPREITVGVVGNGFFGALGIAPILGRTFSPEELASATGTIVLSHAEWQRLLGGSPDAIDKIIDTEYGPTRVIGVMPATFAFPSNEVGGWIPHRPFDTSAPPYRFARLFYGVGWLKDDLDPAQLDQWFSARAAQVRGDHGLRDEGWRFAAPSVLDDTVGAVRQTLWGAFALALLVLVIACANVAILFDARSMTLRQEEAIAHALGASANRIARTRWLELCSLTALGTMLALFIAALSLDLVRRHAYDQLPRVDGIALGWDVVGFGALLALLLPALVSLIGRMGRRASIASVLRGGGKGVLHHEGKSRRWLPALAIALSTISLIAAVTLGVSLARLRNVSPGFATDNVHIMQFFSHADQTAWNAFADDLRTRLAALPGVRAVSMTTAAPLSTIGNLTDDVRNASTPDAEPVRATVRRVGPDYLELLDIPLLAGRAIGAEDREGGERVAVINRELAKRVFGSEGDAVGQSVRLPLGRDGMQNARVVGVMADTRNDGLRAEPAPEVLVAFAQKPWLGMSFMVRTHTQQAGFDQLMAEQLWAIAPRQAITRQYTLADDVHAQWQALRFFAFTVGVFALCAALLGAFGVYSVAALAQRRRVREFGLRLAVGARPTTLGLSVLGEGLRMVMLGATLGVVGAGAVLRLLAEHTFGMEGALAWIMPVGAVAMALVALAALMLPALRAMRVDPIVALRND